MVACDGVEHDDEPPVPLHREQHLRCRHQPRKALRGSGFRAVRDREPVTGAHRLRERLAAVGEDVLGMLATTT